MLAYPVTLFAGEKGLVLVTFPDLPEAVSCAQGEDEAIARAGDVLDIILASYWAEGRPIPHPSEIEGVPLVTSERFRRNSGEAQGTGLGGGSLGPPSRCRITRR